MTERHGWPMVLVPVVRLVQVRGAGDAGRHGALHAGVALDELPASSMHSITNVTTHSYPAFQGTQHVEPVDTGPQCAGTLQGRTGAHRRSSRNLPFHSPQVSQLGKVPTWYMPQSHGSASRCTCAVSTAALQHRRVISTSTTPSLHACSAPWPRRSRCRTHAHAAAASCAQTQHRCCSSTLLSTGSLAMARTMGGAANGWPLPSRHITDARSNRKPSTWYSSTHLQCSRSKNCSNYDYISVVSSCCQKPFIPGVLFRSKVVVQENRMVQLKGSHIRSESMMSRCMTGWFALVVLPQPL